MKEAGWEKETVFFYCKPNNYRYCDERDTVRILTVDLPKFMSREEVEEAPTAQEILDELPPLIYWEQNWWRKMEHYLRIEKSDNWEVYTVEYNDFDLYTNTSLVEAVAELRIRCKENWFLTPKTDD